ncbi:MAG TPA: ABC transporter ATP-binding protein [Lachnospiraceae bacterium]|nr:ABC transporter ATP-binding protein [Lachnospiraceae bacterium]
MFAKINYIFSRKDKIFLILLLGAVVLGSFMELLGVSIFSPFIEIITNPAIIHEKVYLDYIYQAFRFTSEKDLLIALAVLIIAIYLVKNIYLSLEKNWMYKFSYNMQKKLSVRLLTAYMEEPYSFHLNKNIAVLQRSLQEDTDLFAKGIIHLLELFAELAVCVVLGVYLFFVSQSITVIVVGLLLVCVGVFTGISRKFSKSIGKESQNYKGKLYQWMNQALGGIKEIKILNREQYFIEEYDTYFTRYVRGLRLNRLIGMLPKHVVETVCMTGLLLAIILKMRYGQKDIVEYMSQLAVFAVAAFKLLPAVGKINEHLSCILYSAPSVDLIYNDLKDIADEQREEKGEALDWEFKDRIKISNVKYHYPNTEENVIDGVNFEIKKGQAVAFVGASGAGKTTMVDIILGLLSPQYGRIKADDLDINRYKRTWQKEIGYIPQTIYLSDDSIRNNIAFGIPKEEIDEEAVIEALKKAQLMEFVENLPQGLETAVGDRGVRLSGGQRQRIGIARALYHDPEILVLDEATSALDTETEEAVMQSIDQLKGCKTMLIIAHRLTTIKNADVVYEVGGGKVIRKEKAV